MANKLIGKGNEYITEDKTAYVDPTFFNVFKFPALKGDLRTALNEPGTVVSTAGISPLIEQVKSEWKAMTPGMPFSYRFLDESFNEMDRAEQRTAEQRMKEIGIRKVLGASVQGIVGSLSRDFMKLVAIAFVIAAPFAWWVMNKWLQGFVDRAGFSWWIFVVAGLAALFIALATVSFQSVRAALMNPTKSLKAE